jgi:hypothetical protein
MFWKVITSYPSTGWDRGMESFQIWMKGTFYFTPIFCRWYASIGANENQLSKVLECSNLFCVVSGAKVSHSKTKMYFSKNVSHSLVKDWEVRIQHVFREANAAANWLADYGLTIILLDSIFLVKYSFFSLQAWSLDFQHASLFLSVSF